MCSSHSLPPRRWRRWAWTVSRDSQSWPRLSRWKFCMRTRDDVSAAARAETKHYLIGIIVHLWSSSFTAWQPSVFCMQGFLSVSLRLFHLSLMHVCRCHSFISSVCFIVFFSGTDFVFWGLTSYVPVTVRDHLTSQ